MTLSEIPVVRDDARCESCGKSFEWHKTNKPRHPFVYPGEAGSTAFLNPRRDRDVPERELVAQRRAQRAAMPLDPVLRQALIDKGVLTPQDLRDAEEKIQTVTGLFNQTGPVMRGESNGE